MAVFKISIYDGFCTWEYPLIINGSDSIRNVMGRIAKAHNQETPAGKNVESRIRELETALAHTEELLQREREKNAPRTCFTCGCERPCTDFSCTAANGRKMWTPKTKKEEWP